MARQSADELADEYAFMTQIYAELDDPDGLVGLATLRRGAALPDVARAHSAAGRVRMMNCDVERRFDSPDRCRDSGTMR